MPGKRPQQLFTGPINGALKPFVVNNLMIHIPERFLALGDVRFERFADAEVRNLRAGAGRLRKPGGAVDPHGCQSGDGGVVSLRGAISCRYFNGLISFGAAPSADGERGSARPPRTHRAAARRSAARPPRR